MVRAISGPSLLLLLAIAAPSLAQQQTAVQTSTRDPQAVAALQAAISALGGAAPSDSTATGTVIETVGTQSQNGTAQVLTRGTNQSIETIDLPDLSQTTVYSHWLAAQTSGSSAQAQLTGQLAVTSQTLIYPLPFVAEALNDPDVSLQYIGQETVDGAPASHIRVWNTFASRPYMQLLSTFSVHDIWINASGLPVRVSFTQQAAAGQVFKTVVELDFSDYQRVSGFAYPETIEKSLNGTPWLTISIQSIQFNVGLQDIQFQVNCNSN